MTDALATSTPASRRPSPRHVGCGALFALLLVLVVAVGIKAARAIPAVRSVTAELRALQALDTASIANMDPESLRGVQAHFVSLESNLATIQTELAPWLPLAARFAWLPGVGPELAAAPDLLAVASGVATGGRASLDGALPVVEAMQAGGEGSLTARILPPLSAARPRWLEASAALDGAARARAALAPEGLDPELRQALDRLDELMPGMQAATSLALAAPDLLGATQPRAYLLLAQNSDELRPTGGFISGVGRMAVDGGEIGDLDFVDGSEIVNHQVDHPPAPPALERYMQAEILLLRDANWSPDFPASAAVAQALYLLDTGQSTDGVIAFDLEAARRVVGALEPLMLPGYDEPVTQANLVEAMRAVWEAPLRADGTVADRGLNVKWSRHRKDFMGDLAAVARARLEQGDVDLADLAWALLSSLREKHILISLNDPAAAAPLRTMNWMGEIRLGTGDYLMVVDSNVGWNKVNAYVERDMAYRVTPAADGSAEAELLITYRHAGRERLAACQHESRYGDTYADMLRRCYFDYVRVYTPPGATLLSAEGFEPDTLEVGHGEHGATVFAGFLVTPSGESRQVRLRYALPAGVAADRYHLAVQKQPGTPAWPLEVTLVDRAVAWEGVSPQGQRTAEGIHYSMSLASDLEIVARPTTNAR